MIALAYITHKTQHQLSVSQYVAFSIWFLMVVYSMNELKHNSGIYNFSTFRFRLIAIYILIYSRTAPTVLYTPYTPNIWMNTKNICFSSEFLNCKQNLNSVWSVNTRFHLGKNSYYKCCMNNIAYLITRQDILGTTTNSKIIIINNFINYTRKILLTFAWLRYKA